MADPSRTAPRLKRPPVVVMPDTGIGDHPWFPDEAEVGVNAAGSLGVRIVGDPVADRGSGVTSRLTGEFDRLAGHGTFIAGLVRQTAPSARMQSHAIMTSDGLAAEDDVLELLQDLLDEQVKALANNDAGQIIDVLTLSFGCYHEDLADEDSEPSGLTASNFATILRDLGKLGIIVVAGAGNDATTRPFLPAAFAGDTATGSGALPLVSVGALNPNQAKVSLFSNSGTWVTTYRHGAAVISTLPRRQNASSQASATVAGIDTLPEDLQELVAKGEVPRPQDRATIDLDDYTSGFGVWSGTSFAAPILAGQLAHVLGALGSEATDLGSLQKRGWEALAHVLRPRRLR
jgi:subtilisin family serine protease